MVGEEAALEIRVLHRHGKGIREIARATGLSRNTVRRYLRDEAAAPVVLLGRALLGHLIL